MTDIQKYVVMDGDGYPLAFYSVPDVHEQPPKGAQPISDETWQAWIERLNPTRLVKGRLVEDTPPPEPDEPSLTEMKAEIELLKAKLAEQGTTLTSLSSRKTLTR